MPTSFPAVSVVICARNEAANVQKNLESILNQDYPNFEVVVVNDDSEDETATVLARILDQYPHLQVVTIKNKKGRGKKAALSKGIQLAKNEWLLLTDADCFPASKHWIRSMYLSAQSSQTDLVLGFGPAEEGRGWLSKWVAFETVYVAIQYFSFALWRMPYMGVGRNLMYRKKLFEQSNGFDSHQHLTSGDDDLFVNEVANGQNTKICLEPASFMYSPSPQTWGELYRQKTRHYSSSNQYKWQHKICLGALSLSHFYFYLALCIFIGGNVWSTTIMLIFIMRTFLLHLVFFKYLKKINNIKLLLYIGVLDMLVPVYYLVFASALKKQGLKKWK